MIINKVRVFRGKVGFRCTADELNIIGTAAFLSRATQSAATCGWRRPIRSRQGIVAGFLTTERAAVWSSPNKKTSNSNRGPARHGRLTVKPGETVQLETFVIGYFDDVRAGLEAWADEVANRQHVKLPPQPCGYCTWYLPAVERAGDGQADRDRRQGTGPLRLPFPEIDDGWQDGVSRNGPRKNFTRVRPDGPYPSGMKQTAEMIRSHGLMPGIWFMPSPAPGTIHGSRTIRTGSPSGPTARRSIRDWGGTCMDMTNPEARSTCTITCTRSRTPGAIAS